MLNRIRAGLAIVAAVLVMAPRLASAQVNLVGYWNPLVADEDFIERVPGPNVGDYAGLPITDAARKRANTWDASLLTLPEHQCKPHPSTYGFRGVGVLRIWEDRNPQTQQLVRLKTHIQWQEQERDIWMDGRSRAVGARAAHLAGLFDRTVRGRRARRADHAPEGRLDSPQRAAAERRGDDDGTLLSPRRPADARDDARRSDLPLGAAGEDERLRRGANRDHGAVSVPARRGSAARGG